MNGRGDDIVYYQECFDNVLLKIFIMAGDRENLLQLSIAFYTNYWIGVWLAHYHLTYVTVK